MAFRERRRAPRPAGFVKWLCGENGCPWTANTRDLAARNLGYADDLGNLVDWQGNPVR